MVLPPKVNHPKGGKELSLKKREISALVADTFDGKIKIEWDPQALVTPADASPFPSTSSGQAWQNRFRQKSIPRRCRLTVRWLPEQSVGQTLANQRILLSTCAALTGGQPH